MECQVEKLEHFRQILLFVFNRGVKAAEAASNICAVYGDNATERARQENGFLVLRRIVMTLVTLHVQNFGVCWRSFKHINQQWSTSVYSRTGKCDELWPFHHRGHLRSMDKVKKSDVWVLHALSQNHKNQRVVIWASLLAHHRLAREQHRPFLPCTVTGDDKWCLYANIRKRKEWLSPNRKRICRKCSNFSTWHSIF